MVSRGVPRANAVVVRELVPLRLIRPLLGLAAAGGHPKANSARAMAVPNRQPSNAAATIEVAAPKSTPTQTNLTLTLSVKVTLIAGEEESRSRRHPRLQTGPATESPRDARRPLPTRGGKSGHRGQSCRSIPDCSARQCGRTRQRRRR